MVRRTQRRVEQMVVRAIDGAQAPGEIVCRDERVRRAIKRPPVSVRLGDLDLLEDEFQVRTDIGDHCASPYARVGNATREKCPENLSPGKLARLRRAWDGRRRYDLLAVGRSPGSDQRPIIIGP